MNSSPPLYTSRLWFAAGIAVNQHLIIIHSKYRDDLPLLAHERCHQAQMKRVGTLEWWFRYLTDKAFRQQAEVEAYRVQISNGAKLAACAMNLATMYRLDLDYGAAYLLLKD